MQARDRRALATLKSEMRSGWVRHCWVDVFSRCGDCARGGLVLRVAGTPGAQAAGPITLKYNALGGSESFLGALTISTCTTPAAVRPTTIRAAPSTSTATSTRI
jgi:hypothetical protein